MADEELDSILGDDAPPEEGKPADKPADKPQELSEEEQAKAKLEQDLINLGKAKAEALNELSRIREEKKQVKSGKMEEEDIPKINMEDPSSKAWDKHIRERVQPVETELEKARQEVREYALQKFLQEKPALARDPNKVKQLMGIYDRIHTASERTVEGVLSDLDMAYGAISYKEREAAEYQERVAQVEADAQFSSPAISKGATGQQSSKPVKKKYSDEEKLIIAQWEAAGAPHME